MRHVSYVISHIISSVAAEREDYAEKLKTIHNELTVEKSKYQQACELVDKMMTESKL